MQHCHVPWQASCLDALNAFLVHVFACMCLVHVFTYALTHAPKRIKNIHVYVLNAFWNTMLLMRFRARGCVGLGSMAQVQRLF